MINVDWIEFAAASVTVVLAPGPGSVFVAKTAGSAGAKAGHMAMFGIMLGDTCLITLSMLGISALFTIHPSLFHSVRLIGAGYLVFLGLKSIFAGKKDKPLVFQNSVLSLRRAFIITLFNPKAIFFFMAFFPIFIKSTQGGLLVPYIGMTSVFMVISFTYLYILSYISSKVGLAFQKNRTIQSITCKVCGCLFIGFGIKAAAASR